MPIALALVVAAVFGAGDQYLGSFSAHPWAADVSLLSAPWVLLAFVAGWTQRVAKWAAILGLACTFSAFAAYGLMTLSPIENAHLTVASAIGFVHSETRTFAGGLVTGPLFGWLGNRWRTGRSWPGAVAVAAAMCLEPLARVYAGQPYEIRFRTVWLTEVAVGVAVLAYVAREAVTARSR
jgi:hypothetical protein